MKAASIKRASVRVRARIAPVPGADFGVYLKDLRKRAGMTQEELAEDAEVSKSYISALERGRGASLKGEPIRPSLHVLFRLAKALGQPENEVRQAAGYITEAPDPGFARSTLGLLFFNYRQLGEEDQAEWDRLFRFINELLRERLKKRNKDC
jgi:transcriptional regulator with XRE-family HTH domain